MSRNSVVAVTGLAALGVLFSLALPWVWFADVQTAPIQIADLLANQMIQDVLTRYPDLPQALGVTLPDKLDEHVTVAQLFSEPTARKLATLAQQHQSLSGWSIWFEVPKIGEVLWFALLLSSLTALASLMCILAQGISGMNTIPVLIWQGCSGGTLLAMFVLISQIPALHTFGIQNDLSIALICAMNDSRMGSGVWLALVSLLLVTIGDFMMAYLPRPFSADVIEGDY